MGSVLGATRNQKGNTTVDEKTRLELDELHARIIKLGAETAKLNSEAIKVNTEAAKFDDELRARLIKMSAETAKLNAEIVKLSTENRWYPMVGGAAFFAAAMAFVKIIL